jgi:hypothetical protein
MWRKARKREKMKKKKKWKNGYRQKLLELVSMLKKSPWVCFF